MPVRWRGVTTRSVTVVSRGLSLADLLVVAESRPLVASPRWQPAADLYETSSAIVVILELAGVREDELDIALYPDAVIVDGYRSLEAPGPDVAYHALQIRHGPFRTELPLPTAVDVDSPQLDLADGILRLQLKKESAGESISPAGTGGP